MSNYIGIAYGDEYLGTRLFTSAWDDATDDDRTKALYMATEILNTLNYVGDKTESDQENQFPRGGDTEIPVQVKKACALIALALLDGVEPEKEYDRLFKLSGSYGGMKTDYKPDQIPVHGLLGIPSSTAFKLLFSFLRDPNKVRIIKVD